MAESLVKFVFGLSGFYFCLSAVILICLAYRWLRNVQRQRQAIMPMHVLGTLAMLFSLTGAVEVSYNTDNSTTTTTREDALEVREGQETAERSRRAIGVIVCYICIILQAARILWYHVTAYVRLLRKERKHNTLGLVCLLQVYSPEYFFVRRKCDEDRMEELHALTASFRCLRRLPVVSRGLYCLHELDAAIRRRVLVLRVHARESRALCFYVDYGHEG